MKLTTVLGTIQVVAASRGRSEGRTVLCQRNTAAYAEVSCPDGMPVEYGMWISVSTRNKDANVSFVQKGKDLVGTKGSEVKSFFFAVPVKWTKLERRTVPDTWCGGEGRDNVAIYITEPNGDFVQVECSLTTIRGKFYLNLQRIYQGQFVRTTGGRGEDGQFQSTLDVIPTASIHAYPGASFKKIWERVAELGIINAQSLGASERKSKVAHFEAEWKPTKLVDPPTGGWRVGIVLYYNLNSKTGRIRDAEGTEYFAYFKAIGDSKPGEIPMLTPMSTVIFRVDESSAHVRPGLAQIKSVRPIPVDDPTKKEEPTVAASSN